MTNLTARPPIAFVSRLDGDGEAGWLELLAALLPDETLLSFRDMSAGQKGQAEIAIVANPDPADIADLSGLRWIHSLWAGVERLMAELPPTAPPVVRLVDPELSRVMAEAVLAWTYYLHRDMPAYARQQRDAVWKQLDYVHPSQRRVGLLGLGELGIAAGRSLSQAGFSVMGWSRTAKAQEDFECLAGQDGLRRLLSESDILVCLLPLTADTRGLLDTGRLASMKPGSSIINFARGPIVDIPALIAALDAGQLGHAVLDVFEHEPLDSASRLWAHPKVTVLPHISAPTNQDSAARIVAANIATYRRSGALPRTVDRKRGY